MRIAFVVWNFPKISETFILNQITGIIDLGHKVDIFSFEYGDVKKIHSDVQKYGLLAKTTYLWLSGKRPSIFKRFKLAPSVLMNLISRNPKVAFHTLNFFRFSSKAVSLSALFWASRMAGRGPYDVVHCQFGKIGLEFLPFHRLRLLGGKLIVQFRGPDITEFVKQRGSGVYRELFRGADYFLPVCDYFRKKAIELGCPEGKISVLRSGIDCKRFILSEKTKPARGLIRVALVGRLVETKGIGFAIRALSILKQRGYLVELIIVGDGPLKKSLQRLSRELDIERYVIFLGAKNQEEIIKIINNVHLFVAPSVTSKTGNQEGIPNVLKEAMASGLPVVSTYHGGIPELVEDGVSGFLVPERDAEALADRLSYLIDHAELWNKMGKAGRKFVEEYYDKERLNRELVAIYRRLVG